MAPPLDKHAQELLALIYAVEPAGWDGLLPELSKFLGGLAAALVAHDFSLNAGRILFATGYGTEFIRSYPIKFAAHNAWLNSERNYRPPGNIHIGEHLVPEHELLRTRFYTEWLRPQNLHHRLCAVLSRDGAAAIFLEVMRPREWARFDRHDIARSRALLPHLQRALRIHRRMAELRIERDAARGALDHLSVGVILLEEHGAHLVANRYAHEILVAGDGLTTQDNSLRAVLADETARLQRLLRGAFDRAGRYATGGVISITRPSGAPPLSVAVVPLDIRTEPLGGHSATVTVFLTDPSTPFDSSNQQRLRELYALTAAEARLAVWLLRGKSVDEAAASMGIRLNTARAYLKRVYHKTGVRRQPELVRRLLLGLPRLKETGESPSEHRHRRDD